MPEPSVERLSFSFFSHWLDLGSGRVKASQLVWTWRPGSGGGEAGNGSGRVKASQLVWTWRPGRGNLEAGVGNSSLQSGGATKMGPTDQTAAIQFLRWIAHRALSERAAGIKEAAAQCPCFVQCSYILLLSLSSADVLCVCCAALVCFIFVVLLYIPCIHSQVHTWCIYTQMHHSIY